MKSNPVVHCTFIIRSQIEYSMVAQAVVVRCILEKPATGQRRGFTDIDDLLVVLRSDLLELQAQIISPERQNLKSTTENHKGA